MRHDDAHLTTTDGIPLFVRRWQPARKPQGVLVVVPGLKDHAARYEDFALRMMQGGWSVYATDLRGYGRSGGGRAFTRFEDFVEDLEFLVQGVSHEEKGAPIFLFGHCIGGTVAALFSLRKKARALRGLILSAAALKRDPSSLAYAGQSTLLNAISTRSPAFPLDAELFSRDPEVVRALNRDPHVQTGAPVRAAMELLAAVDRLRERAPDIAVPLLALHGSKDRVTPPEGSRELIALVSSQDKTVSIYPGLAHDLLREPERQQVADEIHSWLDARTRAV